MNGVYTNVQTGCVLRHHLFLDGGGHPPLGHNKPLKVYIYEYIYKYEYKYIETFHISKEIFKINVLLF